MAPPQSWKGKRRAASPARNGQTAERPIPPAAYIQAYEAQLVYDRVNLARELSAPVDDLPESSRARGRGLLRWQGDADRSVWADRQAQRRRMIAVPPRSARIEKVVSAKPAESQWVFVAVQIEGRGGDDERALTTLKVESMLTVRHDIIHLLDTLPSSVSRQSRSPSPAGTSSSWDSLPSDAEETFNLSGAEEYEEYERQKRTKWLAALRENRLREREAQDRANPSLAPSEMPAWADDEEPPDATLTLMRHTAKSLFNSPNPQVLEMRILAHHAKDERFAFLRGRYKDAWQSLKDQNRRKKMNDPEKKQKEEKAVGALLGGYESSDEEDEDDAAGDAEHEEYNGPKPPSSPPPPPPPPDDGLDPPAPEAMSPPPPAPVVDGNRQIVVPDSDPTSGANMPATDGANEAEQQRLRRQRIEEWKRKRAQAQAAET